MTLPEIIRDVQRAVGVEADGVAGPRTWEAIRARICPRPAQSAPVESVGIDRRSARNIATLHPRLAEIAVQFVKQCVSSGLDVRIICGTRTDAEQDALYALGRSRPGPVRTNARAGQSWHNYGLAFDIGVFEGAKYLGDSALYAEAGKIGEALGLEWGGRWQFRDDPHFQLRPRWAAGKREPEVLAELARRKRHGEDAVAG